MKYSPYSHKLYTNGGDYIKTISCPLNTKWHDMDAVDLVTRNCSHCKRQVVDVNKLNDSEIVALITSTPDTCIKIDLQTPDITTMSVVDSMFLDDDL